jgi:hypothetical protein
MVVAIEIARFSFVALQAADSRLGVSADLPLSDDSRRLDTVAVHAGAVLGGDDRVRRMHDALPAAFDPGDDQQRGYEEKC